MKAKFAPYFDSPVHGAAPVPGNQERCQAGGKTWQDHPQSRERARQAAQFKERSHPADLLFHRMERKKAAPWPLQKVAKGVPTADRSEDG